MSRDHAAANFPVVDQSAFATFGTLQKHLTHYSGQMRALALALTTQAHTARLPDAPSESNRQLAGVSSPSPIYRSRGDLARLEFQRIRQRTCAHPAGV
jgi:hypothetical protein